MSLPTSLKMSAALESADCFWDFESRYLYIQIKPFSSPKVFKEDLIKQTELLATNNGRKALYEIQPKINLTLEDQFYISHIFIPEMIKKGLKYMAIVSTDFNLYNRLFIRNIQGRFEASVVDVSIFSAREEAEAWLATK